MKPISLTPERCEYEAGKLRLIFNYITPTSRGIDAWCEVRNGAGPPLAYGRLDLMGVRTVSSLANQMGTKEQVEEAKPVIAEAVYDVIQYTLNGPEPDRLDLVEPATDPWLLYPLLMSRAATRLVAAGGVGKSMLALGVAVTVATGTKALLGLTPVRTGPVLYLDWEADKVIHGERLRAICRGHGLNTPKNIYYLLSQQALPRAIHAIQQAAAEVKPVLVIVDSNAMARGVSGEGSAEDSTIRMFSALRSLGLPSLIVDHKSDEKIRRGKQGGYGSVFNTNLARLEWEVVRRDNTGGMVMKLTKANNMKAGRELGFRLSYKEVDQRVTEVRFDSINPTSIGEDYGGDEMARARAGQADLIYGKLLRSSEPRTVRWISEETGYTESIVRTQLNRHTRRLFERVGDGVPALWRARDQVGDEGQQDELPAPY